MKRIWKSNYRWGLILLPLASAAGVFNQHYFISGFMLGCWLLYLAGWLGEQWPRKFKSWTDPTERFPELRFDLIDYLIRQKRFSLNAFGPGDRAKGILDHITKEIEEVKQAPRDLKEWIDIVTLALDGAWRAGYSPEHIVDQLTSTLQRNENRKWPDWRKADPNKAIEHVRTK